MTPTIALVGNAPKEKHALLNALLAEEELSDVCNILLYGADGQQENEALLDAIEDFDEGVVQGIVLLPMQKPLHEVLKESVGDASQDAVVLRVNSQSRLATLYAGTNAADVAKSLKDSDVTAAVQKVISTLERDFMIQGPRVAVLSLNEKLTDNADEIENAIIAPAVANMIEKQKGVYGPVAYGSVYGEKKYLGFDAVLQMYEGQVTAEFEAMSDDGEYTIVSGIDIPMALTTPECMLKTVFAVIDMARNRALYDEPRKNPLQKLFHERKEDGDKARFAVKKKGFNPAEHRRENVTYKTIKSVAAEQQSSQVTTQHPT